MSEEGETIRVLRIINRFNLGGPTFNVAYLTRYLEAPFETRLVGGVKDESEASSEFILKSLEVEPIIVSEMKRSISPVDDLKAYREIASIIKTYRPHIVHTHASKAGTLGRIAAYFNGVPIILHTFHGHVFHSYFNRFKTGLYKQIERWLATRSTRIIAISDIQRHELGSVHGIAPPHKIEVVPLGFDLGRFQEGQAEKRAAFRTQYGLSEYEVAIGIIGRLVPIKNHAMFIDGIRPLATSFPNARFFIIGGGELEEELQRYASQQGIGNTWMQPPSQAKPLAFTSWIKEVDVAIAGLDVVALTSLNEGTPVSLIEAQAAGKPVVSTRVGGFEDIVVEGASALLCDVDDQEQWVANLKRLIQDPATRAAMGRVGKAHVSEQYSFNRLVKDITHLYNTLLCEKGIR
ncbi:MAG: glycosyltransferase [Cryomorphaceae bacterium]